MLAWASLLYARLINASCSWDPRDLTGGKLRSAGVHTRDGILGNIVEVISGLLRMGGNH